MPANAVSVCRPGKFGNPFRVTKDRSAAEAVLAFRLWLTSDNAGAELPDEKRKLLEGLAALRGKDLACFCPLDSPCHADILLEMANKI